MTGCGGALPKKSALTVNGTGGATELSVGLDGATERAQSGDCTSAEALGEDLDMEAKSVPSKGSSLRMRELSPCANAGTLDEFLDMDAFVLTLGGDSSPSAGANAPTGSRAEKASEGNRNATGCSPSLLIEGARGTISSLTMEDALEIGGTVGNVSSPIANMGALDIEGTLGKESSVHSDGVSHNCVGMMGGASSTTGTTGGASSL